MKLDAYSISERSDGFRDEAEERDVRPRWVYSVWRLVGTPDDIDKIAATGLKFHAIMPMPKPFVCTFMLPEAEIDGLNLEKTHGHRDWTAWREAHWGIRYTGASMVSGRNDPEMVRAADDEIVVRMRTGQGLPLGIIRRLHDEYPSVRISISYMADDLSDGGTVSVGNDGMTINSGSRTEQEATEWIARYFTKEQIDELSSI